MSDAALVRRFFDTEFPRLESIAEALSADPAAALAQASAQWDEQSPTFAYADETSHPMASSFLFCAPHLVLYNVLREREGIDAHTYGRAMHGAPKDLRIPFDEPATPREFRAAAVESMEQPRTGRFAFEFVREDGIDWGMNVRACALVHEFSQHDALDLVPYFCHNDDVASDAQEQGLRRTGTIAVGASHCDFRYKAGGEPVRIVD
jgi:hypothetical protein